MTPLPQTLSESPAAYFLWQKRGDEMAAEKTKEQRIKLEYNRLKRSYKELSKENQYMVEGLLRRAAFMRVTLEDMEEDLLENGSTEMFSQSDNQIPYERQRPTAQLYNSMNSNYQKIIRELAAHLPKEVPKEALNPMSMMQNFVDRRGS